MTIIAEYKDLRVHEWATGYAVEHIPTGQEHWMSDGVDAYWKYEETGLPFHDFAIQPRTKAWHKACQKDLRATYSNWLDAYFPDISINRENT